MALIPPHYLNSVIAIGTKHESGEMHWIGTGFLVGYYHHTDQSGQDFYTSYLVTNKHVLQGQSEVFIRFNPTTDQAAKDYHVLLEEKDKSTIWTGHPDPRIDVGVIAVNADKLTREGMKFDLITFGSGKGEKEGNAVTSEEMQKIGVMEGDFVYVLGYPMGMVARDRQNVIVRSGIISRISDLYENRSLDFLVDAFVFPGNSGGPVVLKPEIVSIEGTSSNNRAKFIGIITSYVPYTDVAVSQQTMTPRITFEENTGLSIVHPAEYVLETIQEFEKDAPNSEELESGRENPPQGEPVNK